MRWSAHFYCAPDGSTPVQEYLDALSIPEQRHVYHLISLLRHFGVNLGTEYCHRIRGKIWELTPGDHRFLYFAYTGRKFIIVHAFAKKGQRTPEAEIRIAERRYQDYLSRQSEK